MFSDVWPLPGASFYMALYRSPAAGPTANACGADEDHVIVEPQVFQQLIAAIASLVAIRAKLTG